MLLALIFVPLLGAALMPILRKLWSQGATVVTVLATAWLLAITGWLAFHSSSRNFQFNQSVFGGMFSLQIDGLSLVVLLAISLVVMVTVVFAIGYPLDPDRRPGCYALLLLAVTGMDGLVMATDLFSLYVFLEILSVSVFILIAYQIDRNGLEGAFKYMMLSAVATTLLLVAIALLFAMTGSVAFSELKKVGALSGTLGYQLALALSVCAFALKGGIMPFHGWLPDAYTGAPAPIAVFLGGIVTKVAGIYTLMRVIIAVFGFSKPFTSVLLFLAALSIILGSFFALGQKDFKRMLAFSSISQIGYIVAGFATGSVLGLLGAAFHFFNHAIFKSLLFLNAGSVESATGTRDFEKLGGLTQKMPIIGYTSIIAMLSTAGIPPLGGFWSKLLIIMALWMTGYHLYAVIAVFAGVVTLAYLLSLQRSVFFGKLKEGLENINEVAPVAYFPALLMAAITIAIGIAFPFVINKLILPVRAVLEMTVK